MENSQELAEQLEKKRLKYLKINLIGFIIWYPSLIANTHDVAFHVIGTGMLVISNLIGFILWAWSLRKITSLGKMLKSNKLMLEILGDEFFKENQKKSFRMALIAIGVSQIVFILWTTLSGDISGRLVAELGILILVTAHVGSFIFYQGKEDDGV